MMYSKVYVIVLCSIYSQITLFGEYYIKLRILAIFCLQFSGCRDLWDFLISHYQHYYNQID